VEGEEDSSSASAYGELSKDLGTTDSRGPSWAGGLGGEEMGDGGGGRRRVREADSVLGSSGASGELSSAAPDAQTVRAEREGGEGKGMRRGGREQVREEGGQGGGRRNVVSIVSPGRAEEDVGRGKVSLQRVWEGSGEGRGVLAAHPHTPGLGLAYRPPSAPAVMAEMGGAEEEEEIDEFLRTSLSLSLSVCVCFCACVGQFVSRGVYTLQARANSMSASQAQHIKLLLQATSAYPSPPPLYLSLTHILSLPLSASSSLSHSLSHSLSLSFSP